MKNVIIKIQAHGGELTAELIARAVKAYLLRPQMLDEADRKKHICGVSCPEFSLSASAFYG